MGAEAAVAALRSEAIAKTSLMTVVGDGISTINSESQKQASTVKGARQHSKQKLEGEVNRTDQARMSIRTATKSSGDSIIKVIFTTINSATSPANTANVLIDVASCVLDVGSIVQDMLIRNRHQDAANTHSNYLSLYSPRVEAARQPQ